MKRYFTLFVMVIAMLCSCSDDPQDVIDGTGESYTVMVYSYTGSGMDVFTALYAMQSMYEGTSDKVKMTFQHKSSSDIRNDGRCPELEGTFRLDMDDFASLKGNEALPHGLNYQNASFEQFYDIVKDKAVAVGDSTYRVSAAEPLADFIEWSKEKHPADNYILLFVGHGDGWSPENDGVYDSRALLMDAERQPTMNLSLGQLVSGVKKGLGGKKLKTLYLNNCLMATLENYTGYMEIADYVFGAVETTTGIGLDFGQYLKSLKKVSAGADFETEMHGLVNYLVSDKWWTSPQYEGDDKVWGDIGFTNMSLFPAVLNAAKEWADLVVDESFEKYDDLLSLATMMTMVSQAYGGMYVQCSESLVPLATKVLGSIPEDGRLNGYQLKTIMKYIENTDDPEVTDEIVMDFLSTCVSLGAFSQASSNYILADMMNETADLLEAAQSDPEIGGADAVRLLEKVKNVRERYHAAMRSAAYIACTHPSGPDDAYNYTSYSVLLQSLNADYVNKMLKTVSDEQTASQEERLAALLNIPTYCLASCLLFEKPYDDSYANAYKKTAFDQWTGWSRFLTKLTVNPNILLSDSRDTMN